MTSYGEEELFFYSREEVSSVSDLDSDCSRRCSTDSHFDECDSRDSPYDVWIKIPQSVSDRRSRFLKLMGFSLDRSWNAKEESDDDEWHEEIRLSIDRMSFNSGAELRSSDTGDSIHSSHSSVSWQSCDSQESFGNGTSEKTPEFKIKNLDNGMEFLVDEVGQDGTLSRLREMSSNLSFSFEEFQRTIGSSQLIRKLLSRYVDEARDMVEGRKKAKKSFLEKLSLAVHTADRHSAAVVKPTYTDPTVDTRMQRIKVNPSKKNFKELSSLYTGQEFLAHKGSILTMKFSLDGKYLATGGEDGVVRVWQVIEDDRLDQLDIRANDPSCLYFTMDQHSQLSFLDVDKNKINGKKKSISSNSTCVVFPPKVFRVLEKPLHEFQGHSEEVLDLSWSEKRFLLSSSADNTVRLWQVGCKRCLRIFLHNNYVTCIDFNPVNDKYFISGSIDGKVRIWEVLACQVVDYTDIREIITAVSYRPSGKGAIVGSMTGSCFFYDIIDNRLQLDAQICLQGKKKLAGKRITSFEFSPSDPTKVVVTSADSLVQVLCGMDVIAKFRASGLRVAANQMFASFTSDGKHIVSTSEDSHVYTWNYNSQERPSRVKKVQSFESFHSKNALIAIPWRGIQSVAETFLSPTSGNNRNVHNEDTDKRVQNSSPDFFSRTRGFLLDALTRGSATWPEEKLPDSSAAPTSPKWKSEFKFLKNACQSMLSSSHMWGHVIVTAGWDGRIRTYLNYGLPLRL